MHMERVDDKIAGLIGRAVVDNDDLKHRVIDLQQRTDILYDVFFFIISGNNQRNRQQIVTVDITVKIIGKGFVIISMHAHQGYKKLNDVDDVQQKRKGHTKIVKYDNKAADSV